MKLEEQQVLDFQMLKIIFQIAPVLNKNCELDTISSHLSTSYEGSNFKPVMGLCFNSEIYYQLGKAMISPELLEMISNQTVFSGALIAPSMYIK